MKRIWQILLKIQSRHDSVHRQTDWWTDGQGETSMTPPFNFVEVEGIMNELTHCHLGIHTYNLKQGYISLFQAMVSHTVGIKAEWTWSEPLHIMYLIPFFIRKTHKKCYESGDNSQHEVVRWMSIIMPLSYLTFYTIMKWFWTLWCLYKHWKFVPFMNTYKITLFPRSVMSRGRGGGGGGGGGVHYLNQFWQNTNISF